MTETETAIRTDASLATLRLIESDLADGKTTTEAIESIRRMLGACSDCGYGFHAPGENDCDGYLSYADADALDDEPCAYPNDAHGEHDHAACQDADDFRSHLASTKPSYAEQDDADLESYLDRSDKDEDAFDDRSAFGSNGGRA